MRNIDRLRFELLAQDNGSETVERFVVHPIYDKPSLVYERPDGQMYYEKSLKGAYTFQGAEFWLIHRRSVYCKFTLVVHADGAEVARGYFRKTDCKTDVNHETIDVEVTTEDMYDELESNNAEYNIIKWGLEKHSVGVLVKPTVQAYELEDTEVHIMNPGNNAHTVATIDTPVSSFDDMADVYHFSRRTIQGVVRISDAGSTSWGVVGNYVFPLNINGTSRNTDPNADGYYLTIQVGSDSTCEIFLHSTLQPAGAREPLAIGAKQTGSTSFDMSFVLSELSSIATIIFFLPDPNNPFWTDYSTMLFSGDCRFWTVGARVVGGDNSEFRYDLPTEDIIVSTAIKCSPYPPNAVVSTRTASEGPYPISGRTGEYYAPPTDNDTWYALRPESWLDGVSLWLSPANIGQSLIDLYSETVMVADWYKLGDVIKGFLAQADNSLVFECDTDHSQFLFSATNPVTNEAQGDIYVTQKSNILNLHYQYPAWSACVTWNRLETFLKNFLNCYYDIYVDGDGVRHFRIEHFIFYANGLSYNPQTAQRIDLMSLTDAGNHKPVGFHSYRWQYDQERPYTRWEYAWMDTQSEPFDAFPIQVPKQYMIYTRNTIADQQTDWFSADLDFMLSVPGEVSSDGFAVVQGDGGNPELVHQGVVTIGDTEYYVQNDRLALGYLQKAYLLYGIYSPYVTMDNTEDLVATPAAYRRRMRTQEIEFVLPKGVAARPECLYITEAGEGEVERIEVYLTSMEVNATLRYKIE